MFPYRFLNKFFTQASTNLTRSICIMDRLNCPDFNNGNSIKTSKILSRYKQFEDKDADIIYDDIDMILNQKQEKTQRLKFENNLTRGKVGVFDLEEMLELLRKENFKDILVIKVPKALKYCDYMIICTAVSHRHLKTFIEIVNKIYKLKKHSSDPFLDLTDKCDDWRLIDFKNLILHIFTQNTRKYYDLETLWAIGEEYDDKIQRPETNIVKNILNTHFAKFNNQQVTLMWFYLNAQINCENMRPNFLLMIADDMGFGDLSILGNKTLNTENIDQIGHNGLILSHHLTAASVCTPSRSAFLTGRYPIRNGMSSSGKNRVILFIGSSGGLPQNEITIAKSLKKLNYSTALIGKWHLGKDCYRLDDNCHHPNNHGFDHFFGLPLTNLKDFGDDDESVILSYFPQFYLLLTSISLFGVTIGSIILIKLQHKWIILSISIILLSVIVPSSMILFQKNIKIINGILYRNSKIIEQPVHLKEITKRLTEEASQFIRNATKENRPFFVIINFIKVHTAHIPSDKFKGKSQHGKYGDCVLELDHGVGTMLNLLKELDLFNKTFTYFSSDNGAHLEEVDQNGYAEGGSNGIYRGGKGHGAMEGGIRVPTLVMWPDVFPSNKTISVPTMQMDIFMTIHAIVNLTLSHDRILDGKNILPLLMNDEENSPHDFMFHYCGTYLHAVRFIENHDHVWKVYFYTPKFKKNEDKCQFVCMCYGEYVLHHDPPLVFNIAQDPSESFPIRSTNGNYENVLNRVMKALNIHQMSLLPVKSQFSFSNAVWKPWLQPCCRYPFCTC